MFIFIISFRLMKGVCGFYWVFMKYGVSEIYWGCWYVMGIIFYDVVS